MPRLIDPDLASRLVASTDATVFSDLLLDTAASLAGVDEVFAYHAVEGDEPITIASSSALAHLADRTQAYARWFHHHDPAATERSQTQRGTGFLRRIAAHEIANDQYRAVCFERPRFAEKICYGWRGEVRTLVLTFYRCRKEVTDLASLNSLAQIGLTALTRFSDRASPPPDLASRFETRLGERFPELTPRERQVTSRTVAGWTARSIAAQLNISVGSVLTYRQRTYQKLGVSKTTQFLELLLY